MSDVIEPVGLMEIYCDTFEDQELQGHNMTCLAVRISRGEKIAVARLTFPATAIPSAIERTQKAMEVGQPSIGLLASCVSKLAN